MTTSDSETSLGRSAGGHHIAVDGPIVHDPSAALVSTPAKAAASLLVVGMALRLAPGLEHYRLWDRPKAETQPEVGLLNLQEQRDGDSELPETKHRAKLAFPELTPNAAAGSPITRARDDFEVPAVDAEAPPVEIEDPAASLRGFYEALTRTARKQPALQTRILFHGDSLVASDYVTGTLRRKLQHQFGDAGHGFVLMADAWPAYFHNDIFRFASRGFKVSRIVGPYLKDGLYGLGGVAFKAPPGVRARFGTSDEGDFGRKVSLFRLLYLKEPYAGQLKLSVDGKPFAVVDARAKTTGSGYFDVNVDDGPHMLEVLTAGGPTRTFGVILERKVPGVVLDAIGIQGARLRFLDKQDDDHWREQLQLRSPDLIVYQFGANESGDGFAYSMEDYHQTMVAVLKQAKEAVPSAGCLILAAMDRARKQDDVLITVPIIPHIVKEQEAVAKEVGCAFWNTYQAMGGRGSMAKWFRRGIAQADMTHPTGYGAQILGNWVYQALMQGYNKHQRLDSELPP